MAKVLDKILNFIGLEESELDEEEEEVDEVNGEGRGESVKERQEEETPVSYRSKKGKVVNLHSSAYVKVVIYQPLTYDDTQNIIDNLKSHKPVIVNLESLDLSLAQRILDFLSGAVYAINGTIQKVSKGIFVLAPENVDISGNVPDELKGNSFYTLDGDKDKE